jgi:hypothetical protein
MTRDEATKLLVDALEKIEDGGWKIVDYEYTVQHEIREAAAVLGMGSTLYIVDKETD